MKRAVPLAVIVLALFSSCEFFAASPFPSYLGFVKSQRSLADLVHDGEYRLEVLNNGARELLVLLRMGQGPGHMGRALFFDRGLTLLADHSSPELGDAIYVDINFHFMVGRVQFDRDSLVPTVQANAWQHGPSFAKLNAPFYNVRIEEGVSNDFTFIGGDLGWTAPPADLETQVYAAGPGNHRTTAAFFFRDADTPADSLVALAIRDERYGQTIWTYLPDDLITTSWATPILDEPLFPRFNLGRIRNEVHLTRDGFVVRDEDQDTLRLVSYYTGEDIARVEHFMPGSFLQAYGIDRPDLFLFDPGERILYRGSHWW